MTTITRKTERSCDDWKRLLYAAEDRLAEASLGNETRVRDGDREVHYAADGNTNDLRRAIDLYRRKVEACSGVSPPSGRHVFRVTPV